MRSPAGAIAWEFRQRHRWGLIGVAGTLLVLASIKLWVVLFGHRVAFDDAQTFAFVVVVPLAASFMYFLGVFTFGLAGDVASRQSIYPTRMLTLPMTTGALAGWPMLYGTLAMAALWFAMRVVGVWPTDVYVPTLWPALFGASVVAWMQALTWMPYPARGARVALTILLLTSIDVVVMTAIELKASEPLMLALLAPHVPLAYVVARVAVGKARRGEVPDWHRIARRRTDSKRSAQEEDRFASAEHAQAWFEWRQHGRSLPLLVAILLPFQLVLLFPFRDVPVIIFEVLALAVLTPPFMAAFVAATVSKSGPERSDPYGLPPFLATRPMSDRSLIAAKLKVAIWSTLATWLLVFIAIPLALRLSGASPIVSGWMDRTVQIFGIKRAMVIALLAVVLLIATTWKQLVQSLYVGMSGREWAIKAAVFGPLALIAIIFPVVLWIFSSKRLIAALWEMLPWIAAVLVCMKLAAALWVVNKLHEKRLLSEKALLAAAAAWSASVFALWALLIWLLPPILFRSYFLGLVAILLIPLARLAAAPLALDSNRHR